LSRLPVTLSTIQALIVANEFLERQIAEMEAATSPGYARRRFDLPASRAQGLVRFLAELRRAASGE
jgi:hypothetical protein